MTNIDYASPIPTPILLIIIIRTVTELSFGHITTKTCAYYGLFVFFRKKLQ